MFLLYSCKVRGTSITAKEELDLVELEVARIIAEKEKELTQKETADLKEKLEKETALKNKALEELLNSKRKIKELEDELAVASKRAFEVESSKSMIEKENAAVTTEYAKLRSLAIGKLLCLNGHVLIETNWSQTNRSCDRCSGKTGDLERVMSCLSCGYDLCPKCSGNHTPWPESEKKSTGSRHLAPTLHSSNSYGSPSPSSRSTNSTPLPSSSSRSTSSTYVSPSYEYQSPSYYESPSSSVQYIGPRVGYATVHTGPRGGQYYINKNGNKTYTKS
jgi:hypothetical protein